MVTVNSLSKRLFALLSIPFTYTATLQPLVSLKIGKLYELNVRLEVRPTNFISYE